MSQTTVNLGHVPVNRGEYSPSATYYKDNIVQYRNSAYICNVVESDITHPVGISGVAPYDSDPAVPNTGWAVFANDSNGVGEGVYNVSVDHTTEGQPKKYETLSQALADVPQAKKKGGMSIKFIQTTPAKYTVVKTEGATEQPTGTELQSDPVISSGTYTAGELSAFSTLPPTLNSSLTYYLAATETVDEQEVTTYTTWVITYAQSSDNKYVQFRYISSSTAAADFTNVVNWQGVDDEPTANSDNLVNSGGVKHYVDIQKELYGAKCIDYPILNYDLRADGTFGINTNYKHSCISVKVGDKYVISNKKQSNNVRYAFVATNSYTQNTPIPFIDGTGLNTVNAGQYSVFTIPEGCKYLLFNYPYDEYIDLYKLPAHKSYEEELSKQININLEKSENARNNISAASSKNKLYDICQSVSFDFYKYGTGISSSGIWGVNSNYIVGYIKVNKGDLLYFNVLYDGNHYLNFYFSTTKPIFGEYIGECYLSKLSSEEINVEITAPDNGYLIVHYYKVGLTPLIIKKCYTGYTDINNFVEEPLSYTFKLRKIINTDEDSETYGQEITLGGGSYGSTDYIDISGVSYVKIPVIATTSNNFNSNIAGYAFYDSDYNIVETKTNAYVVAAAINNRIYVKVPTNAKYFRTTLSQGTSIYVLKTKISDTVYNINISELYPNDGIDGTNVYTFETAVNKVPTYLRKPGITIQFLEQSIEDTFGVKYTDNGTTPSTSTSTHIEARLNNGNNGTFTISELLYSYIGSDKDIIFTTLSGFSIDSSILYEFTEEIDGEIHYYYWGVRKIKTRKYACNLYRLINDTWSTARNNWQSYIENIAPDSKDIVSGKALSNVEFESIDLTNGYNSITANMKVNINGSIQSSTVANIYVFKNDNYKYVSAKLYRWTGIVAIFGFYGGDGTIKASNLISSVTCVLNTLDYCVPIPDGTVNIAITQHLYYNNNTKIYFYKDKTDIDYSKLKVPVIYHLTSKKCVDARIDQSTYGEIYESTVNNLCGTQLIDVENAVAIKYLISIGINTSKPCYTGTVFYDSNMNPLTEGNVCVSSGTSKLYFTYITQAIPAGAKYMRTCAQFNWNNKVCAYLIYSPTLIEQPELKDEARLKQAVYNSPAISLLHFSDIHGDTHAMRIIQSYWQLNKSYINDVLNTGDLAVSYYDEGKYAEDYLERGFSTALFALGNHDGRTVEGGWNGADRGDVYNSYFSTIDSWEVTQPENADSLYLMYYYKDYVAAKVRLIVLDSQHPDDAQRTWFIETLANAKELDYTVVIASHFVPGKYTSEGLLKKADGDKISFHGYAVNERTTFQSQLYLKSDFGRVIQQFINGGGDYFAEGGGKFAIWLCGHFHYDYFVYSADSFSDNYSDSSLVSHTPSDVLYYAINRAGSTSDSTYNRDTEDEDRACFNVVVIQPELGLIKVIRNGIRTDKYFRPINELCYDYINKKVISNN